MANNEVTIREATERWVAEFNAFPLSMLEKLYEMDCNEWHEVTTPSVGNTVYFNNYPEKDINGNEYEVCNDYGTVEEVITVDNEDDDSPIYQYVVEVDDSVRLLVSKEDIYISDYGFPMWGTMWQFNDSADDYWLEECGGIDIMSQCGFRIYEHEEWGYFFGIDGAGYNFYEAHWIPLYKARGLQWHDTE